MRRIYGPGLVLATFAAVASCLTAAAGPIEIKGEAKVKANKLVRLSVPAPEKSGVIWDVWPDGVADVEEIPGGRLIFTGPAGDYTVKARVITAKDGGIQIDSGKLVVTIEGPPPKPPGPPGPQPPGPPQPPSPPDELKSFRVIMIIESGDTLTSDQRAVVYGSTVENWLNANCTGGKAGWQRRDKDSTGDDDPTMAALWKAIQDSAKVKPIVTPCVAIERNGKTEIVNLEATPAKMVEVLQRYRGK